MPATKTKQNIPKGWEKKQIKDLLDYERPDKYIVESDRYIKTGTPVLTANKSFILGYTDEKGGIYTNLPAIVFDDFTTDSKFVDFPFKVKSSAIKILKEKDDVDLRFVYEKMKSINFPTGSHKRYYISQYQNMEVLAPPLPEQKKIAEILSAVDEEIQKTEEVISATEKLKRGLMQDLLFGEKKKVRFSDLVNLRKERFDPKTEKAERYVGLEHVDQDTGVLLGFGDSKETRSLKIRFHKGDILFGKLRPYLRKYWKADVDGVCTTEIFVFKPKQEGDKDYIFYLVQSDQFIFNSHSKSFGTKMPRTNWDIVSSFEFKAPDPNKRKETGQILATIDKKILINRKLKEKLTLLKKGLMQDLLSGKIRIK